MIPFFLTLISVFSFASSKFNCEATYDDLNIPHQKTNSMEEFYFCFGFHHGSDRAWEMDFFRRSAQGRNAEVYGFSHLKADLMMSLLNLPERAMKIWEGIPAEQKHWLELYSKGVNKGFEKGKEAVEFKDLDYTPEPWRPENTVAILLLQSFDQTRKTFFLDYEEERHKENWGEKASHLFDEDHLPWSNTILKDGEYVKRKTPVETTSIRLNQSKLKPWSLFPSVFGEESGSNNWVISKRKSKTGYAILANDPHLDLKTPLFWYWIHLKAPSGEVIGASVPGVPVIVSGTNGKVAWGLTNSYINTADAIFVKNPSPDYFESVRPYIKVKFGPFKLPFFFKSFERTKTGLPVIPLELKTQEKMVLKWSGFSLTAQDIYPMFDLFKSQNVTEFNQALKPMGLPAWNYVFADTKGDIGYRAVGKSYRHESKTAFGLSSQTQGEIEQDIFLDTNERPSVLKPHRDYIYTANNRHWPQDALFYGGRGYSYSFRGFRIDELLVGLQDVESFQKIQCDRQVVDARFFVPKILKHLEIIEFKNWNFQAEDSSVALPLYRRLMDIMMEEWKVNEYALYRLLDELTPEQENELKVLYKKVLNQVDKRTWKDFHRLGFEHLSKNEGWKFSPEIAGPGDNHSIDPGSSKWNNKRRVYEQNGGASMRMIIELRERPIIRLGLPGLNRHYTQKHTPKAWEEWKNCTYYPVPFL